MAPKTHSRLSREPKGLSSPRQKDPAVTNPFGEEPQSLHYSGSWMGTQAGFQMALPTSFPGRSGQVTDFKYLVSPFIN